MMLMNYLLTQDASLPPIDPANMFEFVIAGNGVFVRARRKELEAMIPVARCEIRGLQEVRPYVRMEAGKVPLALTQAILNEFQQDMPDESLIWVKLDNGKWNVVKPSQTQEKESVRPMNPFDRDGAAAFLDVHSHNSMQPYFSTDDDKDENGFRLYAVFGLLNSTPCAAVRIGIYGYFWHLDAGSVFVLPEGIGDAVEVMLSRAGSGLEDAKEMEAL
jgi:PRTRC genetic system protein A